GPGVVEDRGAKRRGRAHHRCARTAFLRHRRRDARTMKVPGRAPTRAPTGIDEIEDLIGTLVLGLGGLLAAAALVVLAGAEFAAVVFGGGPFDAGLSDGIAALFALPSTASRPSQAWPDGVQAHLPGPVAYWVATIAVCAATGGLIWSGVRWW